MNQSVATGLHRLKPLVRAAVQNGNSALVAGYLDNGGEINARDQRSRTPLMIAASRGHTELCRLLLERGADSSARDEEGLTSLQIARQAGRQEVVQLLESHIRPDSPQASPTVELDDSASGLFETWLAEDEVDTPTEDQAVRSQVLESRNILLVRPPVDTDADWSDVEIDLPDAETLEVDRELQRADVWELLLALTGEGRLRGAYRPSLVEAVAREIEGLDDGDVHRQVEQMLGEIGCIPEDDEAGWGYGCPVGEDWRADSKTADCIQYLKDLQSLTNDAYAHLRKDVRLSVLLDREGEERVGKMISLAIKDACAAIGSDERAQPILIDLQRQVLLDPYLASRISRIEQGEGEDEGEGPDEGPIAERPSRPTIRFRSLLVEAIQAYANAEAVLSPLRAVERLELTVAGIRAIHRGMVASGHHNENLRIAIERATRLEHEMFTANVRLAISVAEKYGWSRLPRMDRIQEAYIGLIKAIERFDFERGYKFSTYATWWLRQSVTRAIADTERAIRVPVHMVERIGRLASTARESGFDSPRAMAVSKLSELTEMTEAEVRKTLSVVEDAALWEDSTEDLEAVLSYIDTSSNPLAFVEKAEMERLVRECVDTLQKRDADVIKHRFGLLETGEKTLEEVGQIYDVTRERIRQIESNALDRLRSPMNRIAVLADYVPEHG